ncbi:MAG: AMP-binding protein [Desulfobacterales bacterium]
MSVYESKPWLKWYDEGVKPEIEIPDKTYLDFLEEGLSDNPDRPAFHFLGTTYTFKDLDNLSSRFAAYLSKNGFGTDDVVGINLPNIPQFLIAMAGAIRSGCVVSGVSPLLTPKELNHQLNDSKAKVLVTLDAFFEEKLLKIKENVPELKNIIVTNLGDFLPLPKRFLGKLLKKIPTGKVEEIPGKHVISFSRILKESPAQKPDARLTPDNTCLIQYTGGTTGPSKGVVLTHRNIVANTIHANTWLGVKLGEDISCSAFPFFHLAGMGLGLQMMALANTQILIPDPRNTDLICKDIVKYNPTFMYNVPTLYQMLLDNPVFQSIDFSGCRNCISGAAPFSVDSINAFEAVVGKNKVVEAYGMTESSPGISMNPYKGKKKVGSVGIPFPNTRVKLVDVKDGTTEVPVGEPGELIANGPQVMKCYFNKPEETENTLRKINGETWLYTGDVARMDEDGFFYIVDRTKDMLLVGGYNVYSKQIEETLYELPMIEFCAIIGVPNKDRPGSELVKAVIQLKSNEKSRDKTALEKEVIAHCRENLAPYKVPRIVEFVEAIPLTAVGKVDKKALR